ncbi:hypothetical protein MKW92_039974 [Papaver armeniacum]|nr:hypothetical protein MKW92_039974 [Papaver armeniacum]
MSGELVLLDFWPSPFGMRVRIALAEKGIKYEYKDENLRVKSAQLLEMNPTHRKIPVLIHHGKPIVESLIIVQYIDQVWNDGNLLLPTDPYQKAQARFWADFADKKIYEHGKRLWMTKGEEHEKTKKDFIDCLKVLEGELGNKTYFGGDQMGFLDVALIPYYTWFYTYEKCGNLNVEEECPKLMGWVKKCMEKESVSESLPDPVKVYEELKQWYPIS